jgi:hypothetical protein
MKFFIEDKKKFFSIYINIETFKESKIKNYKLKVYKIKLKFRNRNIYSLDRSFQTYVPV